MNVIIRHMTHITNLPAILEQDGLWCDQQARERGLTQQTIGHDHIKRRRARRPVRVNPGGFLCDYVPLYFAHHTPMLYAIHRNGVQDYGGGQAEVIYLVARTSAIRRSGIPFVFTDGSAVAEISHQFTDLSDLLQLDWEVIKANYWKNTDDDGDRERRKQAEFLVHNFLPWTLVQGIAVKTPSMADRVLALLQGQTHSPPVRVMPDWYYG